MAKYTEEALKNSPEIQELDRLCTQQLPLFDGFSLRKKEAGYPEHTSISYAYDSTADYRKVRRFYSSYFSQNGWQIKEDREGSWGPHWIGKFRKDSYEVIIQAGGMDDVEFAFDCEKLSDSGEALPNKALQLTAR